MEPIAWTQDAHSELLMLERMQSSFKRSSVGSVGANESYREADDIFVQ